MCTSPQFSEQVGLTDNNINIGGHTGGVFISAYLYTCLYRRSYKPYTTLRNYLCLRVTFSVQHPSCFPSSIASLLIAVLRITWHFLPILMVYVCTHMEVCACVSHPESSLVRGEYVLRTSELYVGLNVSRIEHQYFRSKLRIQSDLFADVRIAPPC